LKRIIEAQFSPVSSASSCQSRLYRLRDLHPEEVAAVSDLEIPLPVACDAETDWDRERNPETIALLSIHTAE
jgi:hypothetical protein